MGARPVDADDLAILSDDARGNLGAATSMPMA
jgi:hypothetical protein